MDVKEFASLGGKARASKLGKQGLKAHARKMVEAREARRAYATLIEQYKAFPDDEPLGDRADECRQLLLSLAQQGNALGLSDKQIGEAIGKSPGYIRQLHMYGGGRVTRGTVLEVRERDGNKCTLCPVMTSLHVHHVNSPKRHDAGNLITLCVPCHREAHRLKSIRGRVEYKKLVEIARFAKRKV